MQKSSVVSILFLVCFFLPACMFFPGVKRDENVRLNLQLVWQSEAVFENPDSVLFDPTAKILIVSNVNGQPMKKDGSGYLSKVALNGTVLDLKWLTGLDAPKGMGLRGNTLYVADITSLAVVDLASGLIEKYPAQGAKFLNDVTVDSKGRVYVSDMYTDTIYIFTENQLSVWLHDKRLASPNGLFIEGNTLYIGSWGVRKCGLETEVPGHLLAINLDNKKISDVGSGSPLANLDGVEGLGARGFLVTDWEQGSLIHLSLEAEIVEIIPLAQGAADLAVLPEDWEMVVVPMMKDNVLRAYTLPLH